MKLLERSASRTSGQPGSPAEAVIRDAKRRQRRRRGAVGLAAGLVLVSVAVVTVALGAGGPGGRGAAAVTRVSGGPTVHPRAFEHQGLLAFASLGSLYVLDGSTGALRQVGHLRSGAEEPSFSHDGRWLAYIAAGKEAPFYGLGQEAPYAPEPRRLVISASDGSSARVVAKVGQVEEAAWSPRADELLVVSTSGYTYDGSSVWLVSSTGAVRRLAPEGNVYGAVWSPDGSRVAVAFGGSKDPVRSLALEAFPVAGGRPTTWARGNGSGVQWLVPLGWWERQGIAAWVGGNGTVASGEGTLSGAKLVVIKGPGSPLRHLGRTPAIGLVPVAGSSTGWLAFEDLGPNSWGRTPWTKGHVVTCAPEAGSCAPVLLPSGATALDPSWSPDGHWLAYIQAPASSSPSFMPAAVRAWYASERLYLLRAGATEPVAVAGSEGATAPQWSPKGAQALLYVARDFLYLVPKVGAPPLKIAGPLLPARQWASTYYGEVDWRYMFAWSQ